MNKTAPAKAGEVILSRDCCTPYGCNDNLNWRDACFALGTGIIVALFLNFDFLNAIRYTLYAIRKK